MKQSVPTTPPHLSLGGEGQSLHFAPANGFPPGAYRAFLEQFASNHEIVASLHRPLWMPTPDVNEFSSWDVFGNDLVELVSQLNHPVISVGHSMGTAAILMAAIQRPELFRSLVLIEPVLVPRRYLLALKFFARFAPDKIPLVKRTLQRVNSFSSRKEAFDHYRPKSVFKEISNTVLWDYVQHGTTETESGIFELSYSREWEARCYTTVHNLWKLLPQLSVPTLAIRAQKSNTLSKVSWAKWKARAADVDFLEFEDAGHLVPLERPHQLAESIQAWLANR